MNKPLKHMYLILLTAMLPLFAGTAMAQEENGGKKTMTMDVIVTDMESNTKEGEKILFINDATGEELSGITGEDGIFTIELPGGATYEVKIDGLGENQDYQTVKIPALEPNKRYGKMQFTIMYEAPQMYTLDNVYFDVNKATLRAGSSEELDELVRYMERKPGLRVEIAGHTDNTGNKEHNQKLSQRRAERVKTYLVNHGIDAGRIEAKGYGQTQPIATNNTEEGKQKNRRTEVRFLE